MGAGGGVVVVVVVVFRPGKCSRENEATFAYGVYEDFQRKEQTLAVATDLEDAYNSRSQMYLLVQYGVSLTASAGLQECSWKEQWMYAS